MKLFILTKKKALKVFVIIFCVGVSITNTLKAQSLGVNTDGSSPNSSTLLHVKSSNKGILIPSVSLTGVSDATTISTPATSLLIYNPGTGGLSPAGYYYNSSTTGTPNWVRLFAGTESTDWKLTGNAGTTAGTHFVGTTDAVDFVIKTNNTEKFRVTSSGSIGIGTSSPGATIDVVGTGRFGSASNNVLLGNVSTVNYVNFNTTFGTTGYGFRDNAGILEYKHSGGSWAAFAQPPTIPGNTEWWIRPTAVQYIQPMYNTSAKVYDAGQTWAFYYDGTNDKGSFLAGGDVGAIMHRSGVTSTETPTFSGDEFPFVDVNSDAEITSEDAVTYTGGYAYGSLYNGFTGIAKWDAGVRGIGLGTTDGTNDAWPVVGVMGEVLGTGSGDYGQQAIYGWQAAPAGTAQVCNGVVGRTSQSGAFSSGVLGCYTSSVGLLTDFALSPTSYGMLGHKNYGVYGSNNGSTVFGGAIYNLNTSGTAVIAAGNNATGSYLTNGSGGAFTGTGVAVYGKSTGSTNDSWGGYFRDNESTYCYTYIGGISEGIKYKVLGNGTASTIVERPDKLSNVVMFCPEAPEILFQDYGTGKLENGHAVIVLDSIFAHNIFVDKTHPIKVFVQLEGACNGVYVSNKSQHGFEVVELQNGASDVEFSWFVTATRKNETDANGNVTSKHVNVRFPDAPIPPKAIDVDLRQKLEPREKSSKIDKKAIEKAQNNK